MALPLWGQLEKAQDDDETIDQAIAAAVAAHEADPDAHLGSGESLEKHKTESMIDHPAGSVAVDKISFDRVLQTSFDSIDGWLPYSSGSGSLVHDFGSVQISSGATSGGIGAMSAVPAGTTNFDPSEDMFWRSTLRFSDSDDQTGAFGVGYLIDQTDYNGFGFRISGADIYVYMGDFDNLVETQIVGLDISLLHTYEIRYDSSEPLVQYFVDGTLVASFDSGDFPEADDTLAGFVLETSANNLKVMYVFNFMYQQAF